MIDYAHIHIHNILYLIYVYFVQVIFLYYIGYQPVTITYKRQICNIFAYYGMLTIYIIFLTYLFETTIYALPIVLYIHHIVICTIYNTNYFSLLVVICLFHPIKIIIFTQFITITKVLSLISPKEEYNKIFIFNFCLSILCVF